MTGVLAAVAHLLHWNSPTKTYRPRPQSSDYNKHKHDPPSQSSMASARSRARSNSHILNSVPVSDTQHNRLRKSPPDVIRLLVDLNDLPAEDDSFCCPRNCSHCRCSPASLLYSSASCSSITLSPPSHFSSSSHAGSSYAGSSMSFSADGTISSSPQGMTLSDGTSLLPLPELTAVTSTIAKRRGIKELPALKPKQTVRKPSTTSLSGASKPGNNRDKVTSPFTPDTAGFAQRFVGFMRLSSRPEADPSCGGGIAESPREYTEDPFGRMSDPFFDDSYLVDAARVPHPDLYDFSVYRPSTSDGVHYYTETCPEHGKARLYIGVSPIQDSSVTHTNTGGSSSSSARTRSGDSLRASTRTDTRSRTGTLALRSASTSPFSGLPTPLGVPLPLPLLLPAGAGPKTHLRPLLLAQKLTHREVAAAQADSILSPTVPKLRPLVLPQQLARRASHPPRRALPASRSNTFPFRSADAARRRRQQSRGPSPQLQPEKEAGREKEERDANGAKQEGAGGKQPSQQLQLDGIISLLDETGVMLNERSHDDSLAVTDGSEDSESLLSTPAIPASILGPSALLVGSPVKADSGRMKQVEDILGLLVNPAVVIPPSSESIAGQRGSVCAYAL